MVGICGIIGEDPDGIQPFCGELDWWETNNECSFEDHRLKLYSSSYSSSNNECRTDETVRIWVWGYVVGHESSTGYEKTSETAYRSTSEYCLALYKNYGEEFVAGLNGEFVILLYDPSSGEVTIYTDRLGSRPVFYYTSDDVFIFSSQLQTLLLHPAVDTVFEERYLHEHFALERTLGVRTFIRNVEKLPPGSRTRISTRSTDHSSVSYWHPRFDTIDKPYSWFVDQFSRIFEQAVSDRMEDDQAYGLLLSGGIDSRLILAAADQPLIGYHMNDWMNFEADLSQRVANSAGCAFRFLRRTDEHKKTELHTNAPHLNLIGSFDQGHATPFRDRIASEVDVLISGLYSDVLYQHSYTPFRQLPVPLTNESISLPDAQDYSDLDDYRSLLLAGHYTRSGKQIPPTYVSFETSLDTLLRDEISNRDSSLVSHGVMYPSLTELVRCSYYYPLTNSWSYPFHESLIQMMPYRNPYLDTRLIDLQHMLPIHYHNRTNIVRDALCSLSPSLASIPHNTLKLKPTYPFLVQHFAHQLNAFYTKFLQRDSAGHRTQGSWTDENELIRNTDFTRESLHSNKHIILTSDFLDWESIDGLYREHMNGRDYRSDIFQLLTFIESSLLSTIDEGEAGDGDDDSDHNSDD